MPHIASCPNWSLANDYAEAAQVSRLTPRCFPAPFAKIIHCNMTFVMWSVTSHIAKSSPALGSIPAGIVSKLIITKRGIN